jgi:membrane associated rhomboid family serine protease
MVTYLIIALNAANWVFVQGLGSPASLLQSVFNLGVIPGELLGTVDPGTQVPVAKGITYVIEASPNWLSVITSMFTHGGWFHLIGNMWFLAIFGNNVEETMGPVRFAIFYLLCGLAATGAQIAVDPASTAPMVGASGAIGGVMGAYALVFPKAGVQLLVWLGFYITVVVVPAFVMLGYWFILQVASGILGSNSGVAFWAHVGGFVAGILLIKPFAREDRIAEMKSRRLGPPRFRW